MRRIVNESAHSARPTIHKDSQHGQDLQQVVRRVRDDP